MEQIKDKELIILNNLRNILLSYVRNKNLNLKWVCRLFDKARLIDNYDEVIEHTLGNSLFIIANELLVLMTELFNKDGLNVATTEFRTFFNEIKDGFPTELRNMNASEFLKTLRNSIAHNSENNQNFKAIDDDNYSVHLKKKGQVVEGDKVFSKVELLEILEIYNNHKKRDKSFGGFEINVGPQEINKVLQYYKKNGTFTGMINHYEKDDGNLTIMDNFQQKALFRYLQKNKGYISKGKDLEYFIIRFFPRADNKFAHYENKYHLTTAIDYLLIDGKNLCCNDFLKVQNKRDLRGTMPFVDVEFMNSIILSSMAFNLFSTRTASEIKILSDSVGLNLSEEQLSHLRNSFIHGRYFYNYNDGFEIYDGTRELSHIMTIKCDTLYELARTICKPQFKNYEIKKRREIADYFNNIK